MGEFHSGFVAILGRPNVGKSSLMNRFVGEKVAIVSERPQTTRNRILGVAAGEGWQIVFVDTPGLHKPRNRLGEFMMQEAEAAREDVDAVLAVVDGATLGRARRGDSGRRAPNGVSQIPRREQDRLGHPGAAYAALGFFER